MKLVFISIVTTPERSATPSSPGLRAACAIDDVEQRHRDAAVGDAPRVGELVAQLRRAISASPRSKREQLEAEQLDERDADRNT